MKKIFFIFILFLSTIVSCGSDGNSEPVDKCESVNCSEWQQCNSETGICVTKSGRCEVKADCSTGFNCDTNHNCIEETTDLCLNVTCDEWRECNSQSGECILKSGRCETNANCSNNLVCDQTHNCVNQTNPCENQTCSNHGSCVVENDSAKCNCQNGFSASGLNCIDINECTNNTHNCSTGYKCVNSEGSFNCQDINECTNGTCSTFATCVNSQGSFQCTCKSEFVGDGITCTHLMDDHEVTVAEFKECVTAGECNALNFHTYSELNSCNYDANGKENNPMNCVSYYGASSYCDWKGKLLPTIDEWKTAARGGMQNYYMYSGSNDIDEVAWYYNNSNETTHDVKTKMPNAYGLYDMSGNVWEWSRSYWENTYNYTICGGSYIGNEFESRIDCYEGGAGTVWDSPYGFRCIKRANK